MLKEIELGSETPREIGEIYSKFKKGLELNLFFGLFFTIGGTVLFFFRFFCASVDSAKCSVIYNWNSRISIT